MQKKSFSVLIICINSMHLFNSMLLINILPLCERHIQTQELAQFHLKMLLISVSDQ